MTDRLTCNLFGIRTDHGVISGVNLSVHQSRFTDLHRSQMETCVFSGCLHRWHWPLMRVMWNSSALAFVRPSPVCTIVPCRARSRSERASVAIRLFSSSANCEGQVMVAPQRLQVNEVHSCISDGNMSASVADFPRGPIVRFLPCSRRTLLAARFIPAMQGNDMWRYRKLAATCPKLDRLVGNAVRRPGSGTACIGPLPPVRDVLVKSGRLKAHGEYRADSRSA